MPLLANFSPTASPVSSGLLADVYIPCPLCQPGSKVVVASGVVLASSERQRLSPCLFLTCPTPFLKKWVQKADPFWVPDSGPKTGAVFRPLMVIITERWIAVQVLGPESGTENGSAFRPQWYQKKALLGSQNRPPGLTNIGRCHTMVRLDIPPHVPKVLKYLLDYNLASASPLPPCTR